jgi:hypothetical protein
LRPWPQIKRLLLNRHLAAYSLTVALAVTILGTTLDGLFQWEGISPRILLVFSNALTGALTGWLFWAAFRAARREQESTKRRLQVAAELNRQLRSSLQVLSYLAVHQKDETRSWLVRESARRIEWTLREISPDVVSVSSAAAGEKDV